MTLPSFVAIRGPAPRALVLATLALVGGVLAARPAAAQQRDSAPAGVSIGLNYDPAPSRG
jgi:hypothetical protein